MVVAREDAAEDMGYAYFVRQMRQLAGIDLAHYRENQMRRRLGTLMARHGARDFAHYCSILEEDGKCLQEFRDFFTINVSEFFRDSPKFQHLRTIVLPELARSRPRLKVWSAGCSNGAEPYTVAMILEETAYADYSILATDIDETTLARAARGEDYSPRDVMNTDPKLVEKYFEKRGDLYALKENIKTKVRFRRHDLLVDPFENNFDLILCRNVVIYFTDDAKDQLYRRFYDSLNWGGVLFIGATEVMMNPRGIGFEPGLFPFYFKKP